MVTTVNPIIFEVDNNRVLFLKNDSFLTNVQVLTNVGSAAEEPSIKGMAHILEHMFFKGSRKRPDGRAISRAANDIGGKLNAYTIYDHTVYYITVLNDKFEEGMDILADMYQNPLFKEEEFAKELNPILSEYREREDDPDSFLMERALSKYMTGYHPVIGTKETIMSATVDKMHEFKRRYYGGNNCLISIVGGVSEETAKRVVRNCFTAAPATVPPPVLESSYVPGELTLTKPGIEEAYYYRYYPALPARHPDRFKQDVMNYILGGNDSALLFERIREELGMSCYGIYSWGMRYEPFALLGIACGIEPSELKRLDQEIDDQIKRICDSHMEEDRLERAKASILTSIAAKSETSAGMSSLISVPFLKGETGNPVLDAIREIQNVTLDDVLTFAQKSFNATPFKSVLLPAPAPAAPEAVV